MLCKVFCLCSILSGIPEKGSTLVMDCLIKKFLAELQFFDAGKVFIVESFLAMFTAGADPAQS